MDVIEITRQLGAAIQADERYIKFMDAKKEADENADVQLKMAQIEAIRTQYAQEAQNPNADQETLAKLDASFQGIYQELMQNEIMLRANEAGQEIDSMMQYIMQILSLCVNGEDPATCEPQEQGCNCEGGCDSCGDSGCEGCNG